MEDFLKDFYTKYYNTINVTAINESFFSKVMHKTIEIEYKINLGLTILEVGGHSGEHVPYVKNYRSAASYLIVDILDLNKQQKNHFRNLGVKYEKQNVENLKFSDNSFDRVISTCLFHHLSDPLKGFQEIRRVTKVGGHIDILFANDPGLMYRFLRNITSVRRAAKLNLKKELEYVHAIEHRNHFLGLKSLAKKVFDSDTIKFVGFPFHVDIFNLNAFTILRIEKH
jgi:ubiquinone/menaquinone biosynthesis C-methylase UbiE